MRSDKNFAIVSIVIAALALAGCSADPDIKYQAKCEMDGKVVFDTGSVKGFDGLRPARPYITEEGVLFYPGGAYKIPQGANCRLWKITPK